jgi:hypothetical protein
MPRLRIDGLDNFGGCLRRCEQRLVESRSIFAARSCDVTLSAASAANQFRGLAD